MWNAWIAWAPPVCSTYRYRLLWLSAISFTPAGRTAGPPVASTRLIAPFGAMANADTDPGAVPVKPKRPAAGPTAQQGPPRCVEAAARTDGTVPLAAST